MADHLARLLSAIGYEERGPQRALFDAITRRSGGGVVVQAGTGTGKSIGALAAGAAHYEATGKQTVIVTPTRVLMDQYMASDAPAAAEAFGIDVAELRGRAWYDCARTRDWHALSHRVYMGGCDGKDVGCTAGKREEQGYDCGYQEAKARAAAAQMVVTNTDMWLVNLELQGALFGTEGLLIVDEAHQLEDKIRDYGARSLNAQRLASFKLAGRSGPTLAAWIERQQDGLQLKQSPNFPVADFLRIADVPIVKDMGRRNEEIVEAAKRIRAKMESKSKNALLYVEDGAIRLNFADISASARPRLTNQPFALISATTPRTMRQALGVPEAGFVDVGHPFDYKTAMTYSLSKHSGAWADTKDGKGFSERIEEVKRVIERTDGGVLLLFSAYRDLMDVHTALYAWLQGQGRRTLRQDRDNPGNNDVLAADFKADGRAVLFGSSSFATGFDAPGSALEAVILWKLPYPGQSPVVAHIRSRSFDRYSDMMATTAAQAIGRLIRTTEDRGHVHVADSRGSRLFSSSDPMLAHLRDARRIEV